MPGTRKLGRTSDHRKAMLRGMVTYLIENGQIETTVTRAKEVKAMAEKIAPLSRADAENQYEKMRERIHALVGDTAQLDESKLITECAVFADKIAVDEETVRLASHFEAFDNILLSEEPVGRKLDFLLQEMNRETNTIGSKSQNVEIAHIVVDIKSEIEKIREQIQNVE